MTPPRDSRKCSREDRRNYSCKPSRNIRFSTSIIATSIATTHFFLYFALEGVRVEFWKGNKVAYLLEFRVRHG